MSVEQTNNVERPSLNSHLNKKSRTQSFIPKSALEPDLLSSLVTLEEFNDLRKNELLKEGQV